ncbi:hypothetical protein GBF38_016599 [Nibea albiflora]|uniref:Uncharacterized protein n=1 Tax=Nibea albiflora TaxID=240163 RepID=A0ACB7ESE1_NIBAL|nr:hypothetical protein GBF38_016599 [Nibea albiflora]
MDEFNRRYSQRRVRTAWTPLPQEPQTSSFPSGGQAAVAEASPCCEVSAPASVTLPSPSPDHVLEQSKRAASAPLILLSDDCTASDADDADGESQRSSTACISAPHPSPVTPSPADDENTGDEIDGVLSLAMFNGVKAVVIHLLNITLQKFRTVQCYGCQINHPSQKHHPCLEHVEDEYYQTNFQRITKMLFTHPCFIPSIQRLLTERNIRADDWKVKTVALTLLRELRFARNIQHYVNSMYDELINHDTCGVRTDAGE